VPPDVRLAEPGDAADVAAIAGLRHAWTSEQAGVVLDDDSYEERFAAWFEREQHQRLTWLGLADGTPVAMLNLLLFTRMPKPGREPSRWGYLANFYVLPQHRGSGLGTRMLAACTAYADEHGLVRVVLSPSERSVPVYLRAGFEPATSLLVRPGVLDR
jgi:GNAT superfamily N-acetyltransferase